MDTKIEKMVDRLERWPMEASRGMERDLLEATVMMQEAAALLRRLGEREARMREMLAEVDTILTEMGWRTDRGVIQRVRAALVEVGKEGE